MQLSRWWQVLLWALGLPARGLEVAEDGDAGLEALRVSAVYRPEETLKAPGGGPAGETSPGPGHRADPTVVLSVIPGDSGNARDGRSPEMPDGTCNAQGDDVGCGAREGLFASDSGDREEEDDAESTAAEPGAAEPTAPEDANSTDSLKAPKVNCEERNASALENGSLQILNMSQDLMDFLNANGSDCTLVLFYTPWCRFSASLAPHFNSLPRAFPTLHFLALDASQHSSLSTRFGTVAVPNILLFQGAKPIARFNHTARTLETLKVFIFNQTGIEAKKNVVVTQADQIGPLPSTVRKTVDWLLVFSLFFLISFTMYATIRTESIRWLIPGQEQEHAE